MNGFEKERLKKMIADSNNIVFFGGAGTSTESGIPDFRSKDGLYNQHDIQFEKYSPEFLLSRKCLYEHPEVFYEFYRQKLDTRNVKPNVTHKVLAKMEKEGKLKAIITQNIDGLHQKAGSEKVLEIHGTTSRAYCIICGKKYPSDYLFTSKDTVPRCDCKWHGLIRPDVTLYGENLPEYAFNKAYVAVSTADCLIVGGTSLTVFPANQLLSEFKGKHLLIINQEPLAIPLDEENDLAITESLGNVFSEIEKIMEE